MQVAQSGNPLEGKLYDTLQHQVKQQNIIFIPAYDMNVSRYGVFFQVFALGLLTCASHSVVLLVSWGQHSRKGRGLGR